MKTAAHITLVNGVETSANSIFDRGLAYGDGVFETMKVSSGKCALYAGHESRFVSGAERLRLGDIASLKERFNQTYSRVLKAIAGDAHLREAVVKIIVTRGVGGRGYLADDNPSCTFIAQVFDCPKYPETYYSEGIDVCVCTHRLSEQPRLAGIKHLNRLDQVLASAELNELPEGLMLSQQGLVIEGTKTNLLMIEGDHFVTPDLSGCGVNGVLRDYIIERSESLGINIQVEPVSLARLRQSDGAALINSVLGLWPIKSVDGQAMPINTSVLALQQTLREKLA